MALRALVIGKKLREAQKALEEASTKLTEMETREAELEADIDQAETEEEKAAVDEAVDGFDAEKAEAEKAVSDLEAEVEKLERELADIEQAPVEEKKPEERAVTPQKEIHIMKRWTMMNMSERRDACAHVVDDEATKAFLGEVRSAIIEKRSIGNAGYLIPDKFLGLLRRVIDDYSKLDGALTTEYLTGTGRIIIDSLVPEAVWTEQCANLNELDLSFGKIEVDGYKVGGYIKVCNAVIEDSDIDLAAYIADKLGKGIALAKDKAVLYGTGTKMPVGIVTALAAVSETPNIVTIADNKYGIELARLLKQAKAKAHSDFAADGDFWAMNSSTKADLEALLLGTNDAAQYVGDIKSIFDNIVELGFMPNNVIVGGKVGVYHLFQRAGIEYSTTDQRFWTEDQTGFKATARYDGKVVDAGAFVAIGIHNTTPSASDVTFAGDSANF